MSQLPFEFVLLYFFHTRGSIYDYRLLYDIMLLVNDYRPKRRFMPRMPIICREL